MVIKVKEDGSWEAVHESEDGTPTTHTPPPLKSNMQRIQAIDPDEIQHTRVMKKLNRDEPPNLPFLRFESIIGRGGMAVVWRAWNKELKRYVAVKVLDDRLSSTEADIEQFREEGRTMAELHHQGIVQGYGGDCVDGRYYLIMEYVDGYTFGSLQNRKNHIPESDAIIICQSVADAMKYAWDLFHTVHCDIKPENLMVDRDGTVKVMDLGLCRSTAALRTASQMDEVVGTPAYISPEQIYCDCELDCRADIYSLGATLYHLVTGRMLFPFLSNEDMLRAHVDPEKQAPDPRRFVPSLSESFVHLLAGMLVKDRDWRYQTWDQIFNDSQALDEGIPIPHPPPQCISSMRID